jgi:hypothetical protein
MVKFNQRLTVILVLLLVTSAANAQLGVGIDGAANDVKGIFTNVSNLILMIGGVVGLVGGIRVYTKWQAGDNDVQKSLVGWIGACVFLLLSGTVLKTMFGM